MATHGNLVILGKYIKKIYGKDFELFLSIGNMPKKLKFFACSKQPQSKKYYEIQIIPRIRKRTLTVKSSLAAAVECNIKKPFSICYLHFF